MKCREDAREERNRGGNAEEKGGGEREGDAHPPEKVPRKDGFGLRPRKVRFVSNAPCYKTRKLQQSCVSKCALPLQKRDLES